MQAGEHIGGLYDRQFEHDACGLGTVVHLDGVASHSVVEQALEVLERLDHRGATGSDPETGDGAGILLQMPHRFLARVAAEEGIDLPPAGDYGIGMVFLPQDATLRLRCEEIAVRIVAEEGHRAVGWRDVPVDNTAIGPVARSSAPVIRQLIVERRHGKQDAFERKLYVIRRRIEKTVQASVMQDTFAIVSLSTKTIVYKGLLRATQVTAYYPDLADRDVESALALVHSRFSTNTMGTWDLAHPFHMIAHNGEINTVRGNSNWMAAREPQMHSKLFGGDLQKLYPITEEGWSDSAKLDAALELLVQAGRSLEHSLAMLIPPAWSDTTLEMDDDIRAFYEYHTTLMEPWDGPAAVIATDGDKVVATLDRNGLRPGRWLRTKDGICILASEIGVLDIPQSEIVETGRLEPGRMLMFDTASGRVIKDHEIKRILSRQRPYRQWLDQYKLHLDDLRPQQGIAVDERALPKLQRIFGYTREDLSLLLAPMALTGGEPIGSMGDDTPLAALTHRNRLLPSYFKQQFAQVTNPPVDSERERLVMSLRVGVGAIGNLLDETPEHCRRVTTLSPILTNGELEKLRALRREGFRAATISTLYPLAEGEVGLARALDLICREASQLVWGGTTIVILSDRGADTTHAPIPPLLAIAAVHSHLVRQGARTMCGLVVESGEPRETMHMALLIGYGAAAVNPYLALESLRELHQTGELGDLDLGEARKRYIQALGKGLLKICSKMGISTIQSYRGAQIFEAVGLGRELIDRYFPGTISRVGGLELRDIADEIRERYELEVESALPDDLLEAGGEYQFRIDGERHAWRPDSIVALQRAVRDESYETYRAFAEEIDAGTDRAIALRDIFEILPAGPPVPLDEVEPSSEIVRRFATGAMSLGSISREAHETLAIAMNRLGGRSNTGEGGEDAVRSTPDTNGDLRRSAIKQVASGRFGVTTPYLVDADQVQIKMAQGAKPGEGGQLPGHKVDDYIAKVRHSTPGVGLISPPPHHDIYSIEDLAQLIHDLKCVNPQADISVKLVAEAGVGTVAAGVAKAKAEHIVISGHDGGTGASPLSSLKYAGLPWEMGLAEAHEVLVMNDLRAQVTLQVDGGLRTGRDVMVGALLGAEEFGFSTAPLIAAGCIMMRVCHLNTCPVGIATQDPVLRERFRGTPDEIVRYFLFVAEHLRELMAEVGIRTVDELIGRRDLLRERTDRPVWLESLDLSPILAHPRLPGDAAPIRSRAQDHMLASKIDIDVIAEAEPALAKGTHVVIEREVRNIDRTFGAMLAGEIVRRVGPDGLPAGTIQLRLTGHGGQSFGAFAFNGMEISLTGPVNDYVGKGLSGGVIAVRAAADAGYDVATSSYIGNVALYGATSGSAFLRGRAGERFCVRNSGATAVVEGVGDHGCEYMTGGVAVILGPTGRNFAAGMSGGIAFVLDDDGRLNERINPASVSLDPVESAEDRELLKSLLEEHVARTDSPVAVALLTDWTNALKRFIKVMPDDYARVLAERAAKDIEAAIAGD
jgi:glutamate synthase domain-containing protein 2/glutamate synthase domain-containing protein 1/glutamate synthase domain-containing protein 3